MPKLTPSQQAERRSHILAAAEVCFARHGFHGTTMKSICQEAGISPGALYLYFDSKEALIEGLVEQERDGVLASFARMRLAPNLVAGMESCMENCVLGQSPTKIALYLEVVAESMRNPAVRLVLERFDRAIRQELTSFLQSAKDAGKFVGDVSVDAAAEAMGLIVDGLMLRRAINPKLDAPLLANLLFSSLNIISDAPFDSDLREKSQILEHVA